MGFDYKSVSIYDAAGRLGINLNKSGNSRCINPTAHKNGDKHPSMSVSQDGQYFHCFGCKIGGNVVEFVKLSRVC